jgi:hypothetical protein
MILLVLCQIYLANSLKEASTLYSLDVMSFLMHFLLFWNLNFTITDVIHTVGPKGEVPVVLKSCYAKSLQLLVEKELRSIVREKY